MKLHDRIMSLPKRTPGQHDAVVRAAEMAKEADELMAEMAAMLDDLLFEDEKEILTKYNTYMERNNEQ